MVTVVVAGGVINYVDRVANVGLEGFGIEPVRFCNWAAPEWGSIGSTAESSWYNAALIAVATINTIAQINIAQKRYQIAKDYANIAEDRWNRFKNGYMPLEQSMLNEVATEPVYTPKYAKARSDYTNFSSQAFTESAQKMGAMRNYLGLCFDETLSKDLNLSASLSIDDGNNFGYRYEEARADLKNDERWNNRSTILNIGRDNQAQAASYAQYANNILAGLSDIAGQASKGAIGALGYLSERRETFYPQSFSGSAGLTGEAGYGGLFPSLYSGAQLGVSWS